LWRFLYIKKIVSVKFDGIKNIFEYDAHNLNIKKNDYVIVEFQEELSFGVAIETKYIDNEIRRDKIIRMATQKDIIRFKKNKSIETKAIELFKNELKKNKKNIKVDSARINFSCSRIVFYYENYKKMDFQNIFRELTKILKMNYEARLIYKLIDDDVNDKNNSKNFKNTKIKNINKINKTNSKIKNRICEINKDNEFQKNNRKRIISKSKKCCNNNKIDSIGICGRCVCCRSLKRPRVISVDMAKKQNLSLQKLKLAGACGKLMCCLKYECESENQ
jgi:cell fate regulator YaaT (PSP1 superfamily)